MRPKHFPIVLATVIVLTFIFFLLAPAGEPNDSFNTIVTTTHQHFKSFKENLGVATESKRLDIDPKYLEILGFISTTAQSKDNLINQRLDSAATLDAHGTDNEIFDIVNVAHLPLQSSIGPLKRGDASTVPRLATTPYNKTKLNFSIVTYGCYGQLALVIMLAQNIAQKLPNEYLLIYDLGLSESETRSLNTFCNNTKCMLISYDLSVFPSHITDQRMHAYRPILIKDALLRSKSILFMENYMRINGSSEDLAKLKDKVRESGVLGWSTAIASSSRTHHKMFEYFETKPENFLFQPMVKLDAVLFTDTRFVRDNILLSWIKCVLKSDCIDPIGAQSNGCKEKKPLFRYSGCHAYDVSAFNVVLGLVWHFEESKYSLPNKTSHMFVRDTLEHATKVLEDRRRNSSDTSDHPFTED